MHSEDLPVPTYIPTYLHTGYFCRLPWHHCGKAFLAPWWVFVAGAAGWWLAFILRVPVILASKVCPELVGGVSTCPESIY